MSESPLLMNPGPVTLTESVRQAMQRPDICHHEQVFFDLLLGIKAKLLDVYPVASRDYEAIVMTGSGTCAVEAMVNSLAPSDSKTLVICNGVYGERMLEMLRVANRPAVALTFEWGEAIDLQRVETCLIDDDGISHVLVVHNETTTGRLNSLDGVAALCQNLKRHLMIDAVSSFGGEWIDFDYWSPLAVAASANKCLHAVPGIAFVLVQRQQFVQQQSYATSLYLDLFCYQKFQQQGGAPFTSGVHALYALDAALDEFYKRSGWQARNQHYRQLASRLREALPAMGMALYLPEDAFCSMITSFHLPEGFNYQRLHDLLLDEGFVIYAGQAALNGVLFRLANMGSMEMADIERLIDVFQEKVCRGS